MQIDDYTPKAGVTGSIRGAKRGQAEGPSCRARHFLFNINNLEFYRSGLVSSVVSGTRRGHSGNTGSG